MSREHLSQLAAAGQITDRTLVYGPAYPDWTPAAKLGFLKVKRSSRGLALPIALVACLSVLLLSACGYVIYLSGGFARDGIGYDVSDSSSEASEASDSTANGLGAKTVSSGKSSKVTSVTNYKQLEESIARVQIIERITFENGSVVELPTSHGTGFCVTPTGYFLTNRHVVETYSDTPEVKKIEIGSQPQMIKKDTSIVLFIRRIRFEAKLIHISSRFDLAVVKINRNKPLPYFELSSNASPNLLMDVFALGFPGVAAAPSESEEVGMAAKFKSEFIRAISEKCMVSAENQLPESSFGHSAVPGSITKAARTDNGQFYVYHSATIFGGNSGGPLVDKKGTVIGINTAIRRDLDISEVTLSDGSKSILAINDGNLNQAFLTSQFREELGEYIPEKLHWK